MIDASGTWRRPNPAGSGGVAAAGERAHDDRIAYGIPDVPDASGARYAGKRVLVVGSGHSAFNVILDLIALADEAPGTRILWAMRRENLASVWGGGASDALEARGELGQRTKRAVEAGRIRVLTPFRIRVDREQRRCVDDGRGHPATKSASMPIEVIVCTGFRPDLDMLQRTAPVARSVARVPDGARPADRSNEHSCGTVRPHGARELAHPEKDFYVVGMKSYGRAPTFLLATGYEQARSVVAMLAGDIAAAERVEFVLPETGVCSTDLSSGRRRVLRWSCTRRSRCLLRRRCGGEGGRKSGCGCGTSEPALLQIGVRSKT